MTALELFEQAQATKVEAPAPAPIPTDVVLDSVEVTEATETKRARAIGKGNGVQARLYAPQDVMDSAVKSGEVTFRLTNATSVERPKSGRLIAFMYENGDVLCRITVPADAETETVTLKF